jgi:hypothetical protein
MKLFASFKKLRKLHKVLIVITVLIIGIGGWIAYDNRPRPLGDEMVYLGKIDSGGGLFFRDHAPSSTFYYDTDINPQDMAAYFGASLKYPVQGSGDYTDVSLAGDDGNFIITYHDSSQFQNKKKYTATISADNYEIALKYLKKK